MDASSICHPLSGCNEEAYHARLGLVIPEVRILPPRLNPESSSGRTVDFEPTKRSSNLCSGTKNHKCYNNSLHNTEVAGRKEDAVTYGRTFESRKTIFIN